MREKSVNDNLHAQLNKKYREQNRIHSVLYEVTHRCPCNCIHCFLLKEPKNELNIDEINQLFLQLVKEGTIEIALSGGEPFIRKDFPQILSSAAQHRFFITILTTGILFGKPEARLLEKNHIKKIEFSLLGAGPETHDSIMNFKGAFNRLIGAIRILKNYPVFIALKATVINQNVHELDAMWKLAEKLEIHFSTSLSITPRENGDKTPQKLGLAYDEIIKLNPDLLDFAPLYSNESLKNAHLLCRAGCTVGGISPEGDIFPCILMRHKIGNIRKNTLEEIWHLHPDPFLKRLRNLEEKDHTRCINCELLSLCSRCPGISYLETGDLSLHSPIACFHAKAMKKAIEMQNT